ncbi:L-fuculokinase [Leifsonia sp. NPDC014704]|uniref:FGGY-family carbohydrate kinase n=1 Tax=Leifsonia sp. NPDC014704 TaxID=3364123 RepID=UPI0036F46A17
MIFLGVDIGTTRTKALTYDTATHERHVVARPTPVIPTPDGDLRDADEVVRTVVDALGGVLAGLTEQELARVAGLGITSLSEEVVLVRADGTPLTPMPTWYHQTAGRSAALEAGLDPSFSWAKLRWAREHVATEEVATVTTLSGYVAERLVGGDHYAVDHSHASRTGFFDVRDARWLPDVFEATGWHSSLLPPLLPTGSAVGTLDATLAGRLGIPASASTVLAGHDHFCGAYGIGVRGDGELYVSAGTSEAHCLIVDSLPDDPLPAGIGVGRFVDGARFYLHRQLPSGHLYRHWRTLLGLAGQSPDDETAALAECPIGSRGAVLVPGIDTDTRSWLLGVGTDANGPTVLRALFEGLACAAFDLDVELADVSGHEITAVTAAGVPCESAVWREVRAHLTPAPLSISTETESPALGAAVLAQRAVTGEQAPAQPSSTIAVEDRLRVAYRAVYERFEPLAASVIR